MEATGSGANAVRAVNQKEKFHANKQLLLQHKVSLKFNSFYFSDLTTTKQKYIAKYFVDESVKLISQ